MGVSLHTRPMVEEEFQAIMLMMVKGEFTATPVSFQLCKTVLLCNAHTVKNTKSQLKYSL